MFGEGRSESPRMASPWVRKAASSSPLAYHADSPASVPAPARRTSGGDAARCKQQLAMLRSLPEKSSPLVRAVSPAPSDDEDSFFAFELSIPDVADTRQALDERIADVPSVARATRQVLDERIPRSGAVGNAGDPPASDLSASLTSSTQERAMPDLSASLTSSTSASTSFGSVPRSMDTVFGSFQCPPKGKARFLAPEPDRAGNLEYKYRLRPASQYRLDKLVTQLKWRLLEGGGCAIYEIGVLDDGALVGIQLDEMFASLVTLADMARQLGGRVVIRRCIALQPQLKDELPDMLALDTEQTAALFSVNAVALQVIPDLPATFVSVEGEGSTTAACDAAEELAPSTSTSGVGTPGLSTSSSPRSRSAERGGSPCATSTPSSGASRPATPGFDASPAAIQGALGAARLQAACEQNIIEPPSRKASRKRVAAGSRRERRRLEMLRREREGMGIFDVTHPDFCHLNPDMQLAVAAGSADEPAGNDERADDELALGVFGTSLDDPEDVASHYALAEPCEAKCEKSDPAQLAALLPDGCRFIIEALVLRDPEQHATHIDFSVAP